MGLQEICNIENTIAFIEGHLDGKLDLEQVAEAMHYSKFHLHRMFTETAGMTVHDYVIRRQMTEAAKLLVFSERSILDISISCGYESRQAFTAAFKAMYKLPPAEFRRRQEFYPLQLRFTLQKDTEAAEFERSDIRFAERKDIPAWMELMRLVIDGYPHLEETEYVQNLTEHIARREALILKKRDSAAGVMAFSYEMGSIEFFGVHPQFRRKNLTKLFLDKLMDEILPGQTVSMTTYRAGDRADTGWRKLLKELGFAEKELLIEYGYPTQRFVLPSGNKEDDTDGKETEQEQ